MTSNSLTISFLFQIDVGNVNASWNEGVVQVLKKVERPGGETHPYISGQAIRHYLRSTMSELLNSYGSTIDPTVGKFSSTKPGTDPKAPVLTEGRPELYIDDDIFGFMNATNRGTWKREAPLRVSPAYGLFPYPGDRDLGTRSAVEERQSAEAGGSIFETEITSNIFRTTILLELDRIGKWKKFESVDNKDGVVPQDIRKQRIKLLLSSLKYLWGGARRTRMLVDLTPQLIVYARMTKKVPIFLDSLKVSYHDGRFVLDLNSFKETLSDYGADIEKMVLGVKSGFLKNSNDELSEAAGPKGGQVRTVVQAIDQMIQDVDNYNLEA
jgi:CRISPR-associated protein Cst2